MKKTLSIEKIKEFLFLALLILFPFNLRHIFNFDKIKDVEGFREHISWSVSVFEIVFLLLLSVVLFELLRSMLRNKVSCNRLICWIKYTFHLNNFSKLSALFFVVVLVFNFFVSQDKTICLHSEVKIIGAFLLFFIAKELFRSNQTKKYSVIFIFLGGVLQSLITLMQFVAQKSLGLKLLGESVIAPDILGVAKFEFAAEKFIRGYGTFPHPNILGTFLLFALAAGMWLFLKKKNGQNSIGNVGLITGNTLIFAGIFLSYSRSVLFALVIFATTLLFAHKKYIIEIYQKYCQKLRVHFFLHGAIGLIIVFSVLFALYNLFIPRLCLTDCPNDKSIVLRLLYNKAAFATISERPITGVGSGCFVYYLSENSSFGLQPWERQPVHNLYLLITSELGLLGLISFLLFLATQINSKHVLKRKLLSNPLVIIFFMFLILGLFDHFFWTIPQAQTIFWLSLAFFASSGRIRKNMI
ncbi:MAG: O-antigen ligase family protein [Patescibacteria group bacterium]|nr:O-antigen ligase family protein [Patescibacteria group bacterium]